MCQNFVRAIKQTKEQKKNKERVFVAKSGYISQNIKFGLLIMAQKICSKWMEVLLVVLESSENQFCRPKKLVDKIF